MKILTLTGLLLLAVPALAGVAPGQQAPGFTLTAVDGAEHSLADFTGQIVVLEWFNPDCPFVKKHRLHHKTMNETQAAYAEKGVVWLAVNSSAAGKQGAGLERNLKAVEQYAMPVPVLLDPDGEVGMAYGARTTPHMFVIAADGLVAYAGAIDDDRSADTLGGTNYVAAALDALLAGEPVATERTRPYGCSVKY
ncbi:MAG: redoxin domain-containing protein [bacterium]|nr:redoxin domain-containing protein [bacterium]